MDLRELRRGEKVTPTRPLLISFAHNNSKYDCLTKTFLNLNCVALEAALLLHKRRKFSKQCGLKIEVNETFIKLIFLWFVVLELLAVSK